MKNDPVEQVKRLMRNGEIAMLEKRITVLKGENVMKNNAYHKDLTEKEKKLVEVETYKSIIQAERKKVTEKVLIEFANTVAIKMSEIEVGADYEKELKKVMEDTLAQMFNREGI